MGYKNRLYYTEKEIEEKEKKDQKKDQEKEYPKDDYKVVTISLYNEDIELINDMISTLKERGFKRLSRSKLIRLALKSLDLEQIKDEF